MAGLKVDWPHDQGIDSNSTVLSGAKFYVYQNETVSPVTLYSDRDVLSTRANPVVADSAGRFDVVYVAANDRLTLLLTNSADVEIDSWDDFEPEVSTDLTALADYVARSGGDDNRMTGPFEEKEATALIAATSLNLDAMTGNWGHVTGNTTIATLTLAQGSRRTLIFDGTPTLTDSVNLILGGDDIAAHAGMVLKFIGEGLGVIRLEGGMTATGKALIESATILIAVGDESTAITTGAAKITFRMPFAMTLDALPRASLTAASTAGAPAIDINEAGASIFSTKLTVDQSELTSETAATPAVLSNTALADNAQMTIDIDTAGANAAGLKVLLRGYRRNLG